MLDRDLLISAPIEPFFLLSSFLACLLALRMDEKIMNLTWTRFNFSENFNSVLIPLICYVHTSSDISTCSSLASQASTSCFCGCLERLDARSIAFHARL